MGKPLFLKPIEKEAASVAVLSPNPSTWQDEIMQHVLSSLPFLQPFNMKISMENIAPETGSMFAKVFIAPKVPKPGEEDRKIAIPVIATNRKLSQVDIMAVDGGWQPLTESRVNAIFPMNDMGTVTKGPIEPSSPSMWAQMSSPMQNTGGDNSPNVKMSSLLEEILPTITQKDADAFVKAASDHTYLMNAAKNEYLMDVLCKIEGIPTSMDQLSFEKDAGLEPWCYQISQAGNQFIVKAAHPGAYAPVIQHLTPKQFSDLEPQIKEAVLKNGYHTITMDEVEQPESRIPQNVIDIDGLSKCAAWTSGGDLVECLTIPAHRVDGKNLGVLCITEDNYAVQEKCAGIPLEEVMPEDLQKFASMCDPADHGTFLLAHGDTLIATEPLTIKYASEDSMGTRFICESDAGMPCVLREFESLTKCAFKKDGLNNQIYAPAILQFVPLNKKAEATFMGSTELVKKAYAYEENMVKVSSSGSSWGIEGNAVMNVPVEDRKNVSRAQANFMLSMTGLNSTSVEHVLTKSANKQIMEVLVPFQIEDASFLEKRAEMINSVRKEWFSKVKNHPGHALVKLAAQAVQDPKTLDSILSLGFLSPQNIETFMTYIPELEEALKKISELLFAARLGLNSNESDLRACMTTLDSIITDLTYMNNEAFSQMSQMQADPSMAALPQQSRAMPQQAPQQGMQTQPAQQQPMG